MKVNKEQFINSNMLQLKSEVECVYNIDASFGLKGQLLKLSKNNNLELVQSLCILIGRVACIGEEWNFKGFTQDNWANIYSPKNKLTEHIIKSYTKMNSKSFIDRYNEFKTYFRKNLKEQEKRKLNHLYIGNYSFNGLNSKEFYSSKNYLPTISSINLDEILQSDLIEIYANREKWYWQKWIIDTTENVYLFEELIIS